MSNEAFDIESAVLLTVDAINEFIFNHLKKSIKKQPQMV